MRKLWNKITDWWYEEEDLIAALLNDRERGRDLRNEWTPLDTAARKFLTDSGKFRSARNDEGDTVWYRVGKK